MLKKGWFYFTDDTDGVKHQYNAEFILSENEEILKFSVSWEEGDKDCIETFLLKKDGTYKSEDESICSFLSNPAYCILQTDGTPDTGSCEIIFNE